MYAKPCQYDASLVAVWGQAFGWTSAYPGVLRRVGAGWRLWGGIGQVFEGPETAIMEAVAPILILLQRWDWCAWCNLVDLHLPVDKHKL